MSTNTVIQFSLQRIACTKCGIEVNAACNCGKSYDPISQRVADYDATNPGRSTRKAAADLGVSHTAVRKARDSGGNQFPAEVTGRDGKQYPTKAKRHRGPRMSEFTDEPEHDRDLRMLRGVWEGACDTAQKAFLSDQAAAPTTPQTFAEWKGAIIQQIEGAWNALSTDDWTKLKVVLLGTLNGLDKDDESIPPFLRREAAE